MLAGRAFGQPKAQLPPPHPQNPRRSPPHLPLAIIWYPGGAHLPLWSTFPMPSLLQTLEEEEGKENKGKEGSGGNQCEDGNEGFDYRCPWRPSLRLSRCLFR
ncbi:hypothetical protein DAI22_05g122701 [Oryza sativa Japonica Group]|nr:hypothetical protein DAI22_05g122701 [Oryza sativa Japonica Group]